MTSTISSQGTPDLFSRNSQTRAPEKPLSHDAVSETPTEQPMVGGPPRPPSAVLDERFLTDVEVAKRFCVTRQTIWRWSRDRAEFPKPVQLSPGTSRRRLSELVIFELAGQEASDYSGETDGAVISGGGRR